MVRFTDERRLALFPAGTTVRGPHHRESPTRREQGLLVYLYSCPGLGQDMNTNKLINPVLYLYDLFLVLVLTFIMINHIIHLK